MNKVAKRQPCNFIKKRLQDKCFPVNFATFLWTAFFIKHLRWLLVFYHFCSLTPDLDENNKFVWRRYTAFFKEILEVLGKHIWKSPYEVPSCLYIVSIAPSLEGDAFQQFSGRGSLMGNLMGDLIGKGWSIFESRIQGFNR